MRFRTSAFVLLGAMSFALGAESKDKLPVSLGDYEFRLAGTRIGQEQFRVYHDKRVRIEFTRTMYFPEPMRYEYEYELERSLEPRKLEILATRGGVATELKLQRKGDNWRLEVDGRGRKKTKHELGRRRDAVIDFDSPLFNGLAIRSLSLNPGQEKTVDAVVMTLPDLAGVRVQHTYRRVEDEELDNDVTGKVRARVYELTTPDGTHRLWVDPSGIVLKGVFERPAGEVEIVLTRLQTKPGEFPPPPTE